MSEDRTLYGTANTFTVSEETNEVLTVVTNFNTVLDEIHELVEIRYGSTTKSVTEFLDAKQPLEDYIMKLLSDRIKEEMNTTKRINTI